MEFLWRIFPLLRANRLYANAIFNTGLKKWLLRVRDILFVFFYPEYLALVPSATNPVQQLTFLLSISADREGVPTSILGSQPIIWLLSSSPLARRSVRATICHPVSHSFSIRSPSTNICFSILTWICYFGIDPHSYDVLTVILWWLATVNSNTRIVVILFLSSQWDTTWHLYLDLIFIFEHWWISTVTINPRVQVDTHIKVVEKGKNFVFRFGAQFNLTLNFTYLQNDG